MSPNFGLVSEFQTSQSQYLCRFFFFWCMSTSFEVFFFFWVQWGWWWQVCLLPSATQAENTWGPSAAPASHKSVAKGEKFHRHRKHFGFCFVFSSLFHAERPRLKKKEKEKSIQGGRLLLHWLLHCETVSVLWGCYTMISFEKSNKKKIKSSQIQSAEEGKYSRSWLPSKYRHEAAGATVWQAWIIERHYTVAARGVTPHSCSSHDFTWFIQPSVKDLSDVHIFALPPLHILHLQTLKIAPTSHHTLLCFDFFFFTASHPPVTFTHCTQPRSLTLAWTLRSIISFSFFISSPQQGSSPAAAQQQQQTDLEGVEPGSVRRVHLRGVGPRAHVGENHNPFCRQAIQSCSCCVSAYINM